MEMRKSLLVAVAAMSGLAVSPALAEGDVPDGTGYICDEGSPFTQVIFNADGATLMLESEAIPMTEVPAASGVAYDVTLPLGHYLVQSRGDEVVLQVDDRAPKTCFTDDDYNVDYISLFDTYSLGGKVRSGPGMDFDQTGSLAYGEPISILGHTGAYMDGYEWFEIEDSAGVRGYQWGGIMCSHAMQIDGVYEDCPSDLE